MIVLDTNLLAYFQKLGDPFRARIEAALANSIDKDLRITTITAYEQINGATRYVAGALQRQIDVVDAYRRVDDVIEGLLRWRGRTLSYDEESRAIFAGFPRTLNRVTKADRWIAAIARRHDATVWTRNLADFAKVSGLVVFDPIGGGRVDNRAGPTG